MASAADGAASPAEADTAGMDEMVKWRASLLRDCPDADASAPPVGSDLRLHWLTDAELLRFLVAARGKPADAITRLEATLKWRADHVAPGSRCPECHMRPTSHCLVSLGLGESGRPVLYASPPRAESTDPDAAVAHVACELEKAFALPGAAAQWVWLVDMRGYTLWSSLANTRSGAQMASVFSAHYPERLGAVVLLEPPSVFGVLLSAIRPFLDAKTVAKIRSVYGPADVEATLEELLTPSQRAWVDEAMRMPAEPGSLPSAALLPAGAPPGPETPLSGELLGWK